MIRINVNIVVKEEVREEVLSLLCEMAELSRQEEGCIGYEIFENSRSREVLMIVETWENEAVLLVHKASDHFTRIIPRVRAIVSAMQSMKFTDIPTV